MPPAPAGELAAAALTSSLQRKRYSDRNTDYAKLRKLERNDTKESARLAAVRAAAAAKGKGAEGEAAAGEEGAGKA